jgi:hypothetical protein
MDCMDVQRRTAIGEQPRYSALEPLTFQNLCKEILQADPKYRNVQVFGVSGQVQKGIDIMAEQLASSGLTVGQCKPDGQPGHWNSQGISQAHDVLED